MIPSLLLAEMYRANLNSKSTVWKFQDFSVTQVLREINFGEPRSIKTAIFAVLGALNFVDLVDFSLPKEQKFLKLPFLPFLGSEFCCFGKFQPKKFLKFLKIQIQRI